MRYFHEFMSRFYEGDDLVTGKRKFSEGKITIDLMSIVCYNECESDSICVETITGMRYTLVIAYKQFNDMMINIYQLSFCKQ